MLKGWFLDGGWVVRRSVLLFALMGLFLMGIAPAGALSPGYEEVPFTDGAICNFTGEEALYGTPGYPGNEEHPDITELVLQKSVVFEDGQGRVHQSIDIRMDGVRYDLLDGDGPTSFLAYGTITGHGWYELDETGEIVAAFGSGVWRWTVTDLDGTFLGKSSGNIVDFGVDEGEPRLVHNWRGVCSEP